MASFRYWAYDSQGQPVHGVVEAESEVAATRILSGRGLLPYRTIEGGAPKRSWFRYEGGSRASALRLADYASFVRQLATLLEADLPLDQSVRLVASQAGSSRIGTFATAVADSITSGRSLSATLDQLAPTAPKFMVALIRAGEARGAVAQCLVDLAAILERMIEVRNRLISAFAYPAILLVVALAAVAIVIGILVPTLMPMFRDANTTAPFALRIASSISDLVSAHWPLLIVASLLMAALARYLWQRPSVKGWMSGLLLKAPVVGSLIRSINLAVLARTLGTLLRNGVSLVTAVQMAASVGLNGEFRNALMGAGKSINEGGRLSTALRASGLFPDHAVRFMAIGEEASKLSEMLLHLANVEDIQARNNMDTLLTLLTPVITIFIGGMVGGLILTVMQAVLSVNDIAL